MSGFIMTLDSDDDAPRSPSPPALASPSADAREQRKADRPAKNPKLAKKQRQKAKKVAVDAGSSDRDEPRGGAVSPPGNEDAAMAAGFVFDGLGGGFVGRDRHSVWVRRRLPAFRARHRR